MENAALPNELGLEHRMQSFAKSVARSGETGLAIASVDLVIPHLVRAIDALGWQRSTHWRELVEAASAKKPTYFTLRKFPSAELYTFLAQRAKRAGNMQIMDPSTLKICTLNFDRAAAPLLIITESLALSEIQKRTAIEDKVGFIEFFSSEDI